ncbi:c-type cytochrome [Bradyrhizobium cenepequi]|uniref:c-type cytochrome n=1 Tax=Bradyrhizobium cenepequi TaxID=2821403 RepID=UPI001CE258DE|nr:c-type cytochrome [Bradyrhizobium cenepequi]MCA6109777.1 c-type cytochrome [Bradyrhizobium cenepequi]
MFELIEPAMSIVIAGLLAWSSVRSWRSKNPIFKWGGTGLAALASVIAVSISVLLTLGLFKLHARSAPSVDLKVVGTAEQIRRGRAISDSFCSGCHTRTDTLTGGMDVGKEISLPIGSFVASNLTPAGQLPRWSDGDIFRAIRNAVDPDGRWLVIMSYTNAGKLSDEDTKAVIAYIRSLPAAGEKTISPPDRLSPLGIAMLGAGMLPTGKPVSTELVTAPPKGPTSQYGGYLVSYQDCRECHGKDLTGGKPGQLAPLGPDLNVVKGWKLEGFVTTMRTGVDPNGHTLGNQMPWQPLGRMEDEDLRAIYEYLTHLPAA